MLRVGITMGTKDNGMETPTRVEVSKEINADYIFPCKNPQARFAWVRVVKRGKRLVPQEVFTETQELSKFLGSQTISEGGLYTKKTDGPYKDTYWMCIGKYPEGYYFSLPI